ncbi:hypothetical protein EEDFHM_03574 [Methylorubrum populi]
MIRSFRAALVALATVAACVVAAPAPAQTFTLAEIGLENSGGCPKLAARDRTSNVMVPIGCINPGTSGPRFKLMPGVISMQGEKPPIDLSVAGTYNPSVIMAAPGNQIAFCPNLSCIRGPYGNDQNPDPVDPAYFGTQRATFLISGGTQLDGAAQEQLLAVIGTSSTGKTTHWLPNAAYKVGDNVDVVNANESGAVYRAKTAGTSGTTSPPNGRPNSLPFTFNDGGVTWEWINDPVLSAKANIYNEQIVKPGSANTWGMATNVYLSKGVIPKFHAGTEMDFGNDSGTDCGFSNGNCYNLYVRSGGGNMLTSQLAVESTEHPTAPYSAYWGVRITGPRTAKLADFATDSYGALGLAICTTGVDDCTHSEAGIADASKSPIAYHIRQRGSATMHTVSSIVDDATTPTSLNVAGSKTYAAIYEHSTTPTGVLISGSKSSASFTDDASSPVSLNIAGTKSIAGIYEHSSTPAGISLSGTYSRAQIEGAGWSVAPSGFGKFSGINIGAGVPSSSSSPCNTGDLRVGDGYFYACVATNRWQRTTLSPF